MENADTAMAAKFEVLNITRELMPAGIPCYLEVVKFPMIKQLTLEVGFQNISKVLFLMVRDFCNSVNVVRNMSEDQMIEAAGMLLDECDNFRLEDYQMMFTLAKRGGLVKIMDRIDIQLISAIMDAYYAQRRIAGERFYEQQEQEQKNMLKKKAQEPVTPQEEEAQERFGKLAGIMTAWKDEDDKRREEELQKAKQQTIERYATKQGVNANEVLKQFSKDKTQRPDRTHPHRDKIAEVYGILKSQPEALNTLSERMGISREKLNRICDLQLSDEQIVLEFIGRGETLISELLPKII